MRRRNSYSNGKSAWFLINNQPRGWKLGTKITTFSLLSCGVLVFPARWGCLRCWEARNFGSTFVVIWLCSLVKSPFFTSREKIKIIPLGQPQHNLWSPASTPWGTGLSSKVWLYALWESEKFWQHFCCNLALLLNPESLFCVKPPKRKSGLFHLANPKKIYQLSLLHLGGLDFPARWDCLRYGWEKNLGSTFVVIWCCSLVRSPYYLQIENQDYSTYGYGRSRHNVQVSQSPRSVTRGKNNRILQNVLTLSWNNPPIGRTNMQWPAQINLLKGKDVLGGRSVRRYRRIKKALPKV